MSTHHTEHTTQTDRNADILDVRDLIERVEDLDECDELDDDERDERDMLRTLLEDLAGNGGDHQWQGIWYPVTLIHESYWADYARQYAEDIGLINDDAGWPLQYIDWDAAADALQVDYTDVEYDGVTYWYR